MINPGNGGIIGNVADHVDDTIVESLKDLSFGIIDTDKKVRFVLYTEKNPDGEIIVLNNTENLKNSSFDPSLNTLFFAHGWFDWSGYKGLFPAAAPPMVRDGKH